MKKTIFSSLLTIISFMVVAQETQTKQGVLLVDTNTTIGSIGGVSVNGTGILLSTIDGDTFWNLGGEMGYFVVDGLAAKVGFAYADFNGTSYISWKVGAKYYLLNFLPVQLDVLGQSGEDIFRDDKPLFLGFQGGYALFLGDMVSIEPSLRYSYSLNNSFPNVFQVQLGFSLFL